MQATLHIGTEKTGTKTLQEFLHCNRNRLLEQGILYTRSFGLRNNQKLALFGYEADRRDDVTIRAGIDSDESMQAVKEELLGLLADEVDASGCDRVLFSSEHLQSRLRSREDIERLRSALSGIGLHVSEVIVYLRDPVSICRSLHASSVATGSVARRPPPPDSIYFSTVCDHRRTLTTWADVFGPESILPRLFERETMLGKSVMDDFCQVAGIDITDDYMRPADQNESLSQLAVELLSRVNVAVPRIRDGKIDNNRKALVDLIRRHCSGPSYSPPTSLLEQYRKYYADSNEWVRRHYFPERETLFMEAPSVSPGVVGASEMELDVIADLIVSIWRLDRSAEVQGGSGSDRV